MYVFCRTIYCSWVLFELKRYEYVCVCDIWITNQTDTGYHGGLIDSVDCNTCTQALSYSLKQAHVMESQAMALTPPRFGRYPGFSAILPPEAEMWTDQELDVRSPVFHGVALVHHGMIIGG